ncbi:hypothetical protein H0H92_006144 [Tricholoma furcatifolium]|nr:hypothetical protein H0H92_006144 [Tricholoma furcatifolium]
MAPPLQTRPEPMNSSPHHSKVKVSLILANPIFVAGKFVAGKMEMECRADQGLGIGVMMVELFAVQELTSRDHTATSTFLHSRRLFQGPGLPPSNAVQAYPQPGDPPYPLDYHQARRGISTFLFRIPLPSSAPSSISLGLDLARVRYELCATAGVFWKGEKRLVVCKREIDVAQSYEEDFSRTEPEGVVVGEFGKIWMQGRLVGGVVIAGETACVELQVKNHSTKKNTGLTLALTRSLVLPGLGVGEIPPLQISDVLTTVSFRGPEYIIQPGSEGVACLVFDVPSHARGVRGGLLEGGESEHRTTESLFEVRCVLGITLTMGIGKKDIHLDITVPVVHPAALPDPIEYNPYPSPEIAPMPHILHSPYAYHANPVTSPMTPAFIDPIHNQVWLPPPPSHNPHINDVQHSIPVENIDPHYYFPPSPHDPIPAYIPLRPVSAGPIPNETYMADLGTGPMPPPTSQHLLVPLAEMEPEEGKGERASRVAQHLRLTSRNRSVSPRSHRFPVPAPPAQLSPASAIFSTDQLNISPIRSLPPTPLVLPTAPVPVEKQPVYSPRPFLSPKRSFDGSFPKSERVEELERMAEVVEKTTSDLSSDLPKAALDALDPLNVQPVVDSSPSKVEANPVPVKVESGLLGEVNINKTLPGVPPPTKKAKEKGTSRPNGRTRIDEFFAANAASSPIEAPPPPRGAITPVKLPSKPKSAEFRAQLPQNGHAESGLDALEKRLLAEVGTRKMDLASERRPAWSVVQPIAIPVKDVTPEDPMNDSAISSLTLAGERMALDRDDLELDGAIELDVDHDSDEKTHRAGKSTASAGSRKSKDKGDKVKKKVKKVKDKAKEGEGNLTKAKKKAATKGRVAAWLGEIDPQVPPLEQEVPPSPAVSRKVQQFLPPSAATDVEADSVSAGPVANEPLHTDPAGLNVKSVAGTSAPNPRSSGFVPIGTFKAETLLRPFKALARDATVVEEARRVTDIWASSAPVVSSGSFVPRDVPTSVSSSSREQLIRPDRRASSPSGMIDMLGANHYNMNAGRSHNLKDSPSLSVPQFDSEAKYDVRSARGGRGGRVTAITSIWPGGGVPEKPQTTASAVSGSKPVRSRVADPIVKDALANGNLVDSTPVTPKALPRVSTKAFVTPSAPVNPNLEPKSQDLPVKNPRTLVKSPSVPAIVSSSHAVPTISSTASLARPHISRSPHSYTPKVPPTISEVHLDSGKRAPLKATSSKPVELAFGQARLRDLIKKYQGPTI